MCNECTGDGKDIAYPLWGKRDQIDHLLEYHLIDVASTCACYLSQDTYVSRELSLLLGCDEENCKKLVCFLCSIHDIGKTCNVFQNQSETLTKYRHDLGGYHILTSSSIFKKLSNLIISTDGRMERDVARTLLRSSAMHHGSPKGWDNSKDDYLSLFLDDSCKKLATVIIQRMVGNYGNFQPLIVTSSTRDGIIQASNLIAGIISNCDWIASGMFEHLSDRISLGNYRNVLEKYADKLFSHDFLKLAPITPGDYAFEDMFGYVPSPIQTVLSKHEPIGPEMCVVEDATGAGKTEAALSLAIKYIQKGICDGITFALPTRSTSNLMYRRMRSYANSIFDEPVNISLLHASSEDFLLSEGLIKDSSWTSGKNKSLFANLSVCTIDQVLGAIMPIRYQTMKLLSLVRHVLIIDEVHSYDAYTFGLVCNLLRYCKKYNVPVILLSATIPSAMKSKMFENYCVRVESPSMEYPLATFCGNTVEEIPCESSSRSIRVISLRYVSDSAQIMDEMVSLANSGMRACWIRNTVDDAIASYKNIPDGDFDKLILHSRFITKHRTEIEQRLFEYCGKGKKRKGLIVISTQVIEQSLDIEFERVYSDLAPIDSLIQRMGRDQRFGDSPISCEFVINGPPMNGSISEDWYRSYFDNAAYVYKNHYVLFRTAELMQRSSIDIPSDYRDMIEYAYAEPPTDSPFLSNYNNFMEAASGSGIRSQRQVLDPAEGYGCSIETLYKENPWETLEEILTREKDDRTYQCMLIECNGSEKVALSGNPETSLIKIKKKYVPDEKEEDLYEFGKWKYIRKIHLIKQVSSNGHYLWISKSGVKYTQEMGAEYV